MITINVLAQINAKMVNLDQNLDASSAHHLALNAGAHLGAPNAKQTIIYWKEYAYPIVLVENIIMEEDPMEEIMSQSMNALVAQQIVRNAPHSIHALNARVTLF